MTKGARTKRLMLDAATDLFQRQGLHATGVNQVLVRSGAPRGSLYFHFPGGKQQLAVEAVESAGRHVHELIEEILRRSRGENSCRAASRTFSTSDVLQEVRCSSGT